MTSRTKIPCNVHLISPYIKKIALNLSFWVLQDVTWKILTWITVMFGHLDQFLMLTGSSQEVGRIKCYLT